MPFLFLPAVDAGTKIEVSTPRQTVFRLGGGVANAIAVQQPWEFWGLRASTIRLELWLVRPCHGEVGFSLRRTIRMTDSGNGRDCLSTAVLFCGQVLSLRVTLCNCNSNYQGR